MLTITSHSTYQGGTLKETIPGNLVYEHLQLSEMPYLSSLLKSFCCLQPAGYEMLAKSDASHSDIYGKSVDEQDHKGGGCFLFRKLVESSNTLNYATLATNPDGRVNFGNYLDNSLMPDIFDPVTCEKKKSRDSRSKSKCSKNKKSKHKDKGFKETSGKENERNSSESYQQNKHKHIHVFTDNLEYTSSDFKDLVVISRSHHHHHHNKRRSRSSVGSLLTIREEDLDKNESEDMYSTSDYSKTYSTVEFPKMARKDYGSIHRKHTFM